MIYKIEIIDDSAFIWARFLSLVLVTRQIEKLTDKVLVGQNIYNLRQISTPLFIFKIFVQASLQPLFYVDGMV